MGARGRGGIVMRMGLAIVVAMGMVMVMGSNVGVASPTCEELGFTGLALCSDCQTFAEFVKDQELVSDCRKCCAQEAEDSITKATYARVTLEVCIRKLAFYPNVQSFIDEKADRYPALKVQYQYGSPPKLILFDDNGNTKEVIRIDNWKREHIEQFLEEKVKPKSAKL